MLPRADKTDEFLPPMVFFEHDKQRVRDGDVVLFFNFRADRARAAFRRVPASRTSRGFDRAVRPKVHYVTLTEYDATYDCPVIFAAGEPRRWCSAKSSPQAGLKQLRIAETEKYPHVTYFFNGGVEKPYQGRGPGDHPVARRTCRPTISSRR